tara:strand:- start:1492 stop:2787 length:1296 start_codon:yes stop_codon:yes gene_type:complete
MNVLERFIYDFVKENPKLKNNLKKGYQSLCDLLPTKPCVSDYKITAREGAYFGFHDKIPFSPDDSKLLAMQYDIPLRMPLSEESLSIGYYDGDNYESYTEVTKTSSWNWHQGCQLQWCGLSNDRIIFNDFVEGKNVSRIVSVDSRETELLTQQSIATVSPDGRWGIGYSFERVNICMPGYGYAHGRCAGMDEPAPDDDGLYRVDLVNGVSELVVSLAQVVSLSPDSTMQGARHYFSHAIIAPDGKRVMFLHRWIHQDVTKRWSRMLTCDLDGGALYVFPTSGMVSHMAWKDSEHILAYSRDINNRDGYVLFKDQDSDDWERLGDDAYNSDGHPSYAPGGRWLVTDTYPDRSRRSYVTLYDTQDKARYNLAYLKHWKQFATPSPDKHWACDLHPRWNRKGDVVCFDSVYTGKRSLCTIRLAKEMTTNTESVR